MPDDPPRSVGGEIRFAEPLELATIVRRPNRFIIEVDIAGSVARCHCPTTGRIGNLVLDGLPCLISRSSNPHRKTANTVEAISVDDPKKKRAWIGINQGAVNRYVESALVGDLFPDLVTATAVERERGLGLSRLDFLVNGDSYIEVKTPLEPLQVSLGAHVRTRTVPPLAATDRLVRHITELGSSLGQHRRAVMLVCFLYDNPGFLFRPSSHHDDVKAHIEEAVRRGVEIWQANFALTPTGVRPLRAWPIHHLIEQ